MQGQRSPKANNKSLGFVNELKTKAISRYVKKTIPPSLKRLLLNSQACRKPSVKPYNQHEPCKACEQGGLLAPHWPHPRGYHSLKKAFLTPHTSCKAPSCASYCRRAGCHCWNISQGLSPADGYSRGKAIDLNILESRIKATAFSKS